MDCGTDTLVGATEAGAGNIISGNSGHGIFDLGTDEVIQGNRIGVDANGNAMGNTGSGVYVGSSLPEVGGKVPGAGNIIAFNGGDGVTIATGVGNPIRLNSIHDNGGLGIDLNDDGPSPNDPGDADGGANATQNFPILTSAIGTGGLGTVSGTLDTAPGSYVIDFYGNPTAVDPEGQTYLGSFPLTVSSGPPRSPPPTSGSTPATLRHRHRDRPCPAEHLRALPRHRRPVPGDDHHAGLAHGAGRRPDLRHCHAGRRGPGVTAANWIWAFALSLAAWIARIPVSEAAAQPDASPGGSASRPGSC